MFCWREKRIALPHCADTVIVPVHESRVQVRRRRLLICQAIVAFDPFARRKVVVDVVVVPDLGHGGATGRGIRDQTHVRVAGAPGAYFAVRRRACSPSAAGEESCAAVFLLAVVNAEEGESH